MSCVSNHIWLRTCSIDAETKYPQQHLAILRRRNGDVLKLKNRDWPRCCADNGSHGLRKDAHGFAGVHADSHRDLNSIVYREQGRQKSVAYKNIEIFGFYYTHKASTKHHKGRKKSRGGNRGGRCLFVLLFWVFWVGFCFFGWCCFFLIGNYLRSSTDAPLPGSVYYDTEPACAAFRSCD